MSGLWCAIVAFVVILVGLVLLSGGLVGAVEPTSTRTRDRVSGWSLILLGAALVLTTALPVSSDRDALPPRPVREVGAPPAVTPRAPRPMG